MRYPQMWRLVAFDHMVRTRINDAKKAGIQKPRLMIGYPTLVYYEGCFEYPKAEIAIDGVNLYPGDKVQIVNNNGESYTVRVGDPINVDSTVQRGYYDGVFRWAQ